MTSPDRPLRARYIGYATGTENHGDEALVGIIRDLLAPEIDVAVNPPAYDLAILGGGTLINQSPWLIDVFGQALDAAGRGVVFGSGVGDTAFWGDQFAQWVPLLRRCRRVGVRGPASLDLLREHGFENAVGVGDPYLWLRSPVERRPTPRRLGVNVGSTNDSLWGTSDADLVEFVAAALGRLREAGWSFSWFPVWSRDGPLLERLRAAVDPTSPPLLDVRCRFLEAYSALAACEVFLGEKLHACAMAAVAGVPFVALEYQPKVWDFAASLGQERWTLRTAERDVERLVRLLVDLAAEGGAAALALRSARDDLRRRLSAFGQAVKCDALASEGD